MTPQPIPEAVKKEILPYVSETPVSRGVFMHRMRDHVDLSKSKLKQALNYISAFKFTEISKMGDDIFLID